MCRGVQFSDGSRADCVGELRAALGAVPLVFDAELANRPSPISENECLCWVDIEATALAAGATVDQYADPFDWTWRRSKEPIPDNR